MNKLLDDFTEEDKIQSNLTFWKPKEDKEIIGLFVKWENDNFGEHAVLQVEDEKIHLPNLMALNSKLKLKNVVETEKVKVVYLGEKKSEKSGRIYEDFDVYVK